MCLKGLRTYVKQNKWFLLCLSFFCIIYCIFTSDHQAHLLFLAWQWLQAAPSPVGGFLQHLPPQTLSAWLHPWPPSHLSPHHLAWAASAPVLCLPIPCWAWYNREWAWGQWVWVWGLQEWAWAWCRPAPWACPTVGSRLWLLQARPCWGLEVQHLLSWFWVGPLEQEEWWEQGDQWEAEERRERAPILFFFEEVSPLLAHPFQPPLSYLLPPSFTPLHPTQFVSKKKNVYISIFKEKKTKYQKLCLSFPSKASFHFRIIFLPFISVWVVCGWEIEIYLFLF